MTNHCAAACPIVTEAVKAATPESKIAMALAAIESDKIGFRAAAERFGVPRSTLQRKTPTGPNGPVGVEGEKLKGRKGKDGRESKPPAKPDEIDRAWGMKDSGMSAPAIAKDLGRGDETVRRWLKKDRPVQPEPIQPILAAPKPEPQKPKISDNLKQSHQREQKRIKDRWMPIAEHLKAAHDLIHAEKERLCREYAGAHGSLIMQRRWQQMAEFWAESGLLHQFAEATGKPEAITLKGVLCELERSSRMANNWISCIAVYTGCRPDSTRYQAPVNSAPDP